MDLLQYDWDQRGTFYFKLSTRSVFREYKSLSVDCFSEASVFRGTRSRMEKELVTRRGVVKE